MASYSVSHSGTSVSFTVRGLSAGDKIVFFVRYDPAPSDGSMLVSAETGGGGPFYATGSTYSKSFSVLSPGNDYACNVAVNDVGLGTEYFSTGPARPSDWSWSGILYSGCPLENLTAGDWRDFQDRIDEFRAYKGLSAYGFTRPVSGVTPLITLFREAEAAIDGIPGSGTVPTGRELAMTYFDGLADALNAVN